MKYFWLVVVNYDLKWIIGLVCVVNSSFVSLCYRLNGYINYVCFVFLIIENVLVVYVKLNILKFIKWYWLKNLINLWVLNWFVWNVDFF